MLQFVVWKIIVPAVKPSTRLSHGTVVNDPWPLVGARRCAGVWVGGGWRVEAHNMDMEVAKLREMEAQTLVSDCPFM